MKKTNRGFNIYSEFTDLYNTRIRIQESSLATQPAVWIFTENEEDGEIKDGKPFKMDAHLSIAQAKRVVKALQAFIEKNRFVEK